MTKRIGESGNIFFTLFGAVALVGIIGVATSNLMRGPVGTVMKLNQRAKAESQLQIARKMAALEAAQQATTDCDFDTFLEPLPPDTASAGCTALGLTGGGCLPSTVGASKNDPWGTRVGYCAWDHGPTTGTCDPNLLAGTNGSGEVVIAVISAGPDRNFDASCSDDPGYVTAAGDDIVMEWTYDDAVQGAGGLWALKSSDPNTAEILNNRNIEVGGSAAFQSSASFARDVTLGGLGSRLDLTAGSLLNLPDQTVLGICNAANDRALRVDTSVGMVLQICENGVGWVDIGGSGAASSVAGADGDVQFNSGDTLYAIDTFNYDVTNDRLRIGGNAAADDTLEVTGTADISGDLQANQIDIVTGGSAAAVGLSFNSAGTLGVYGSGSTVGLAVGGSSRLSATATGVGVTGNFAASGTGSIGGTLGVSGKTTISNDLDVTGAFQVDGDISDSNSAVTVNDDLVVNQSLQVGTSFAADNFELDTIGSGEGMYLYTSGTGTGLSLDTSGVNRLTIDGGGNAKFTGDVGIGLAGDPTTGLDVGTLFRLRSDPGVTAGTACTLDGSITYTSGDELLICSNITGNWETIGTSGGGGGGGAGIWERTTGTIRINPTYFNDADNFVVGSSQMDDEGSGNQDERMLFENATGAFRAGVANGTEWDTRGNYSAAFGLNTQATADSTFAVGNNAQARATEAIAMGRDVTVAAGALNSMALGLGTAAGVDPQMTGTSSLGIFMQDQSGVTFAADNTMGLFGGRLMIDPNAAATQLATSGSLTVDVEGDVGAIQFCSEDGTFCFTAQDVATGATGAPGNDREVIFNSAGSLYTNTSFVYTSAGQLGLGTITPQSRVHAYNGGSTAALLVEGDEASTSDLNLLTSGDGASTVGDATATGWTFSARGNAFATASVQNDLMYYYWDGSAYQQRFLLENDTGNLVLSDTDVIGDTKLDVDGTIKMSYGGETCDAAREGAIRFMSSDNSFYVCQALANGWQRIITAGSSGAGIPAGGADREIQFNSGGDLAGLSTFVLTSAGRFGLGTATPAQTFDVTGTANITGATTLGSSLGVTGQVNFSSGLNVTNATVLSNTLDVTGATTLNNTLDVVGANATTLGGSLGVTGQVDFSSGLNVTSATVLSDVLYVSGAATLASSLDVTGQVNFSSGLNVTNTTVLSNTLDVNGATTLNGLLTTTADANLGGLVTFTSSGAVLLPVGDTGQRPVGASNGMIRYNTDNGKYEAYQGGIWQDILTSAVAGGAGAPDRGVQFNSGGNFAADANFTYTSAGDLIVGSYQIEDTGTGTEDSRMFFDVSNSAFRAGRVAGAEWDYSSAGSYSAAFGSGTIASGNISFAAGWVSKASGVASTAFGLGTVASGDYSVAMGNNTDATGNNAVALGTATGALGDYSTALGRGAVAAGVSSTAIGSFTSAGDYSMAIGLASTNPATDPAVSGQQSLGIFMGDQNAVDLTSNNTMGLYGGSMIIDPAIPAADVVADTALDVNGTIKMSYGSEACDANRIGAVQYSSGDFYLCQNGTNWQRIIVAGAGGAGLPASGNDREIQFNSGGDLAASSTFVLTSAGRFGLGTATPVQTFDVTGTANISGATTLGSSLGVTGQVNFSSGLNVTSATVLSSTLGVTGATTLDGLLTTTANSNLGGLVSFSSTGAFVTNVGTTAQRPIAVQSGMLRFNSDTNQFEGYNGADWNGFMTGAAGVDRQILFNSGGAVTGNAGLVFEAAGNVNIGAGNFYFTSAGRLGIGTTTPTLTGAQPLILDVEGATGSQFFCDENGNNCFTAAAVAGGSAPAPGADTQVVFNSGGVLYASSGFVFSNAGNIGIGTSTPGANKVAIVTAGFDGLDVSTGGTSNFHTTFFARSTGAPNAFIVRGGGNVGIGTTSPRAILDINGTDAVVIPAGTLAQRPGAPVAGMFRFSSSTNQFEGYNGTDWNGFMTGAAGVDRQILFNSAGVVTGNADLVFEAAGNVNIGAGNFYFTSAGRLGIGTTTPTLTGAQPLMVDVEGATGSQFFCDNNGNNCFTAAAVAGGSAPAPGADTQVVYNSGGVLYASSGFVYTSAGRLGIGTTSPIGALHVLSSVDGTAWMQSTEKSFITIDSLNSSTGAALVAFKTPLQQWNIGQSAVDGNSWENDFYIQDTTYGGIPFLIERNTANIGMGRVAPRTKLDVLGTIKIDYGGEACDANREGAIHFNSASDRFFVCQSAAEGWVQIATNNADPGAPDRGIQFNSGGDFTASANLIYQSTGVLELARTYTGNDAGPENGIFTTLTVEPTGNQTFGNNAVAPYHYAGHFYGMIPATNTFQVNSLVGGTASVENYGTGTVNQLRGGSDWAYNASTGDVSSLRGRNTHVVTDGGNITELTGTTITTAVNGGTTTNNYGLRVNVNNGGGTITNRYGVYLNNPNGAATNDYGIYQAGTQRNYLAGDLGIGVQYASAALDVAGTIKIADGGETCTVAGDGGMVRWNGTVMQYCDGATWQNFASGATASPAAPDRGIQFNSGGAFTADANFSYTSAGRLGIGTSSPEAVLDLAAGTSGIPKFYLWNQGNNKAGMGIDMSGASWETTLFGLSNGTGTVSIGFISSGDGVTYTERMEVRDDGILSLGDSTSGQKLNIFRSASGNARHGMGVDMTGDSYETNLFGSSDGSQGHFSFGFLANTDGTTYTEVARLWESGLFYTSGTMQISYSGEACDAAHEGAIRYDNGANTFSFCASAGSGWQGITLGSGTLAALGDTNITGPVNGEVLYYSGGGWVNNVLAINDLSDGITNYTSGNMYMGTGAGTAGTSASYNTVLGTWAGSAITSGGSNTAFGYSALSTATTGSDNVAIGRGALSTNNAADNTAVGTFAMLNNASGAQNVAIGRSALYTNVAGGDNVAIGIQSLVNSTGNQNVALGSFAGSNVTSGSSNILIGYQTYTPSATTSNYINIGNMFYGSAGTGELFIGGDGALTLPSGASATRPGTLAGTVAVNGMIRYNSTSDKFEGYQGGTWQDILTSAVAGGAAAPDRGIQFNSGGDFAAATNFVYTSAGDLIVGSSQIQDTGTGTEDSRMFFDVSNSAFRAGFVDAGQWDYISAGQYSAAFGQNTIASGNNSMAMGWVSKAQGNYSFAQGVNSTASGVGSVAMGNSLAAGNWSQAFGGSITRGLNSAAFGSNNTVSGDYSFALGYHVTVGDGTGGSGFGDASVGFGLYNGSVPLVTTNPMITGDQSFGIFMGNQDSVVLSSANTMGLFGGKFVIDPSVPAVDTVADTALDVNGTIKMAYGGEACDASREGSIQFTSAANTFYFCANTANGWESVSLGSGTLAALSDTTISGPANGDVLYYSGGGWINNALAINDLSDAEVDTVNSNMFIGNTGGGGYGVNNTGNIALGLNALDALNNSAVQSWLGDYNIAIGQNALTNNTTGWSNIAIGYDALAASTTREESVAIGTRVLSTASTGWANTAIGYEAGQNVTSGELNVALGRRALNAAQAGSRNTTIGSAAGRGLGGVGSSDFNDAVLIGNTTGQNLLTGGDRNTFVGANAGLSATTGTDNILLGYGTDVPFAAASNYINIGGVIYGSANTGELFFGSSGVGGAVRLPVGDTSTRPGTLAGTTAVNGMIRYNSTSDKFEGYQGGTWQDILTSAVAGGAAAPDRGIQFNSGGDFAAASNFVYTSAGDLIVGSYQKDDTGTGSEDNRMFFDVTKAAFRAGGAWDTAWDDANVGMYSFAAGQDTYAPTINSTALGYNTTASGAQSFAVGYQTRAIAQNSTAMGNGTTATGFSSFVVGRYSSAGGDTSLAFGRETLASGDNSVSFGLGNPAGGLNSLSTVSGASSFGIFMGDQDAVDLATANTMGLFGGKFVIDPSVPAVDTVADTALDVNGTIKIDYGNEACDAAREGAIRYDSGADTFSFCALAANGWEAISLGAGTLAALSDTTISGAAAGEVLYYSGGSWVNNALALTNLSDVDTTGFADGDVLLYSAGAAGWVPGSAGISNSNFTDLADTPSAYTGQSGKFARVNSGETALEFTDQVIESVTGANAPTTFDLNDLGDVTSSGATDAQVLQYDSASGNWVAASLSSGSVTAAGTNGQIQYNSNGTFAASSTFVYTSAGRLGLGVASPVETFEVAGGIKFSSSSLACNVAAHEGAMQFGSGGSNIFEVCANSATGWEQLALGGTVVGALGDLSDVTTTGVADANILYYSAGAASWVPKAVGFTDLADTPSSYTAQAGRFAVVNSGETGISFTDTVIESVTGQPAPDAININDLGDVSVGGVTDQQVLQYDSATGNWVAATFAGSGTPGGANRQIQFNSGGSFGGNSTFVYTSAGLLGLGVANPVETFEVAGGIKFASSSLACNVAAHEGAMQFGSGGSQLFEVCANSATGWQQLSLGGAVGGALGDLSDVTVASLVDGQFLSYNSATGNWVNASIGASIWTDSGAGYIEYNSGYGGMRVANITGAAAPVGATRNVALSPSTVTAAGNNRELQFNSGGSLSAISTLVYTSVGRLGIGLGTPSAVLDVAGEIKFASSSLACSTVADEGSMQYGSGGSKIFEVCADSANGWEQLALGGTVAGAFTDLSDTPSAYTGQGGRFAVVNSGETGLSFTDTVIESVTGQPSPNRMNLTDLGDVSTSGVTDQQFLQYDSASGTWLPTTISLGSGSVSAAGADTQIQFNSGGTFYASSGFVYDYTNGRLGVGTSTPSAEVDVVGDVKISNNLILSPISGLSAPTYISSGSYALNSLTDVDTTGFADGNVLLYSAGAGGWVPGTASGGGGGTPAGSTSQIQFNSGGAFAANANFVYTSAGSLGLGTSSPVSFGGATYKTVLHIKNSTSNGDAELVLDAGTNSLNANPSIDFALGGTKVGGIRSQKSATSAIDGGIVFDVYDGSTMSEGMRISTTGNVGINNASPAYTVDVTGDIKLSSSLIFTPVSGLSAPVYASSGSIGTLGGLSDVDTTGFADGNVLLYSAGAGAWVPGTGGGGSSTLAGLTDTTITSPSASQVLTYNGSAWVNSAASGLWTDSGSGYIEYSSTYGGMKVASITGAALPTSGAVGSVSTGGASALDDLSDATTLYSSANMFVGQGAGASNTTSNNMTAIGYNALNSATFSNHMTAIGAYAGENFVPQSQWSGFLAIGSYAAQNVGTSSSIVAVGNEALQNFPGYDNTVVGNFAMAASNGGGGDDNVAVGSFTAPYMAGSDNVIIGSEAFKGGFGGDYDHGGNSNVIIGRSAARDVQGSTTSNNIIIGQGTALSLRNGSSNVLIGQGVDVSGANAANEMNIANVFYASGLYSTAHFGINNSAPSVALDVTGDIEYTGTITDVSDMRLKTDITPLDTDEIMKRLAQVDTYSFRMKDDPKGQVEFGVMAQELEKVFPELVKTANDEMGTKSVNYVGMIAPLIEASKELKSENDDLRAQIAEMKTAQAQFQNDIMREVNGLKAHTGYGISKAQIGLWTIALMFGFSSVFFMVGGILRHRQRKQE